jgi:hypothetical protein
MLPFWGEKRKGQRPFRKGKRACEAALANRMKGRTKDATVRWCAAAANSRSRAASRLTRGGRQPIGSVGPKGCLGQILL